MGHLAARRGQSCTADWTLPVQLFELRTFRWEAVEPKPVPRAWSGPAVLLAFIPPSLRLSEGNPLPIFDLPFARLSDETSGAKALCPSDPVFGSQRFDGRCFFIGFRPWKIVEHICV